MNDPMILRSMLFVPGDRTERFEKALNSGADAIIIDLEDAVAIARKDVVRASFGSAVPARDERPVPIYVRINGTHTRWCLSDIEAAVAVGADGIMVPKCDKATAVEIVAWTCRQLGANDLEIIPILETAAGIANAREIMASGRRRVNFGAGDLGRDLALIISEGEPELHPYRSKVVVNARTVGALAPLDTVWGNLRDLEGLAASARRAKRMGFGGKLCIHPSQIAPIHAAFTPSEDETRLATAFCEGFEQAEARGDAAIEIEGHFIDYPVYEQARAVVALSNAIRDKEQRNG